MSKDLNVFYNQSKHSVDLQNGGRTDRRKQIAYQWLKNSHKILDIGCNDGSEDKVYLEDGKVVHGVDISVEAVKRANKIGVRARVLDVSSKNLPFSPSAFDAVVAGEIIEHLVDTDGFLEKIYKVLRPGGKLIITTPNLASLGRRILLFLGKNPFIETSLHQPVGGAAPVGHLRYFTRQTLEELLRANHFEIEKTTSDNLSLGFFSSTFLAETLPEFGWRLITLARKPITDRRSRK